MNLPELDNGQSHLAHRWLNTLLAVLAALTAIASAVAHHYDVVVKPEACPAVSTVPTSAEINLGEPLGVRAFHP